MEIVLKPRQILSSLRSKAVSQWPVLSNTWLVGSVHKLVSLNTKMYVIWSPNFALRALIESIQSSLTLNRDQRSIMKI